MTVLERLAQIETQVRILTWDSEEHIAVREAQVLGLCREYDRLVDALPEVQYVQRVGIWKGGAA